MSRQILHSLSVGPLAVESGVVGLVVARVLIADLLFADLLIRETDLNRSRRLSLQILSTISLAVVTSRLGPLAADVLIAGPLSAELLVVG